MREPKSRVKKPSRDTFFFFFFFFFLSRQRDPAQAHTSLETHRPACRDDTSRSARHSPPRAFFFLLSIWENFLEICIFLNFHILGNFQTRRRARRTRPRATRARRAFNGLVNHQRDLCEPNRVSLRDSRARSARGQFGREGVADSHRDARDPSSPTPRHPTDCLPQAPGAPALASIEQRKRTSRPAPSNLERKQDASRRPGDRVSRGFARKAPSRNTLPHVRIDPRRTRPSKRASRFRSGRDVPVGGTMLESWSIVYLNPRDWKRRQSELRLPTFALAHVSLSLSLSL